MRIILLIAALMPCACRDQRPPAPTVEQSNQLTETENMLNELAVNQSGNST